MPTIVATKSSTRGVVVQRRSTVAVPGQGSAVQVQTPTTTLAPVTEKVRTIGVGSPGPQGPKGDPGADGAAGVNFTQAVASATWTINHNLGYRPSVEVFDAGGNEIEGEVTHPSSLQTIIRFVVPVSGTARLN
jgi:hypothetical protein